MYKCNDCDFEFREPKTINTTYESYYGVAGEFMGYTPLYLDVCPNCKSENINIIEEKDNLEDDEL